MNFRLRNYFNKTIKKLGFQTVPPYPYFKTLSLTHLEPHHLAALICAHFQLVYHFQELALFQAHKICRSLAFPSNGLDLPEMSQVVFRFAFRLSGRNAG